MSKLQGLKILAERLAKIVPAQGKFHRRLQEPQLVARVIAIAFETVGVDGPAAQQLLEPVGQLNLPARPRLDMSEALEDLRRQDVASDDREIRRRFRRLGLFHHVADSKQAVL